MVQKIGRDPSNNIHKERQALNESVRLLLIFHQLNLGINPDDLNVALTKLLTNGGPDQHYTFIATEDLRPYNISASYILQVRLKIYLYI